MRGSGWCGLAAAEAAAVGVLRRRSGAGVAGCCGCGWATARVGATASSLLLLAPDCARARAAGPALAPPAQVRDCGGASPRMLRSTLNAVPATPDLMNSSGMALALVVQPMALPDPEDDPVPVGAGAAAARTCVCGRRCAAQRQAAWLGVAVHCIARGPARAACKTHMPPQPTAPPASPSRTPS